LSDIARAAEVSRNTVVRFERGDALKLDTVEMIQCALEKAGVILADRELGYGSGRRKPVTRGEKV
jgi:hypothetical protein